jgi:predicted CopG family antitoxin
MSTKTITVREEAYKLLLELKKEKESFSDVLLRALGKKL